MFLSRHEIYLPLCGIRWGSLKEASVSHRSRVLVRWFSTPPQDSVCTEVRKLDLNLYGFEIEVDIFINIFCDNYLKRAITLSLFS